MSQTYYCPKKDYNCPICNTLLIPSGQQYTIEQLFALWKPIEFTLNTIQIHKNQSNYTELYNCPNCKLEIFLPQIIGSPEFYTESYDKNALPYSDDKWEFTEIRKDIKNSTSLLEIGCGEGAFLNKIKIKIPDVIGIEYNKQAIKAARKSGLTIFTPEDYDILLRKSFDTIVSFHVLEHMKDPVKFIQLLSTLIKDDGKICLSVPNQDGIIQLINPCVHNMPPHHATRWHKKTFEVLAQRLNLSIERISYEPLATKDHYYYTAYWINSHIIGNSIIKHIIRGGLRRSCTKFFEFLDLLGIKYFIPLNGQSIYIVFKKHAENNI
jgi:SAM-dependent methyltransferase